MDWRSCDQLTPNKMAASRLHPSFRHEGHIFFIYDHRVKKEEDDPSDAILYFYPASVSTDQQIAIVGGIIGITDFCLEFLPQSMPSVVKLSGHNFALLQHEEFIVGLAGSPDIPDNFLTGHMQFVWSTFMLYQGSLGAIRERVGEVNFVKELNRIWDMYLPLCQLHSDPLSLAFKVLPYVQLHKSQGSLYLHASHILQRTLRYKGVVAGALFSWKKVLCSQLSNGLTRQLLLLMTQSQFPCVEANSVLELPGGVRLLHVFIPDKEYKNLTHRRKKVFNSPALPILAAPNLKWTNQETISSQNAAAHSEETVFNSPLQRRPASSAEKYSRSKKETSGVTSGNLAQTNQSRWSYPARDSSMSPSAGGGVTSGTDSEVFVDTLTEASFDKTQVQPSSLPSDKQKEIHPMTREPSFNFSQSRSSELFVPATSYASSSEPNSPEQKDLVVFAEVHTDPSSIMERGTPDYLTQARTSQRDSTQRTPSASDEVLVFSQTSGKSAEDNCNAALDEETFSPISNLRTDGANSSYNNKPNVVETIVDFIYPTSGQKKTKIISKTVVPNGVVPSHSSGTVKEDLSNLAENRDNKKLPGSENSTDKSQNNSVATSSGSQFASGEHDNTQPAHNMSVNDHDSKSSNVNSQDLSSHGENNKNLSLGLVAGDHHVVSGKDSPTNTTTVSSAGVESEPHGEAELVSTAEQLVTYDTDAASETHVNSVPGSSNETNKSSAEISQVDSETNVASHVAFNSPLVEADMQNETLGVQSGSQDQNETGIREIEDISIREQSDVGQEDNTQKELVSQNKGEVSSSSSSSQGSRPQSEEDTGVRQVLARSKQEIDASLERRLSGEDSSALSSAEQHRHSIDSSMLSLAAGDLGPSKLRLTFEASESDNSDTGIMSPLSEGGLSRGNCLSPVDELKTDSGGSKKTLREGDEDYTMRRLSSDFESRHVRGSSRSSQGEKSADSANSPIWETTEGQTGEVASDQPGGKSVPKKIKLHRMTLYAQGHSDTLLLLLLSKNASCSKSYINSLWKTCLSHLAELDFEVKDAERHMKDDSENIGAAYQYMRYDSFSQSLKGSALLPVSSLANEMVDTCVKMHDAFETMPDVQDVTFRSHSACCFGHRAINTETFFQLGQPRNAAGICAQNDRTFSLDQLAGRILQNDVKISIL